MKELGDEQACGRACGNLGNTCYLLGDFGRAIQYHTERLEIANKFVDKAAERRANSNLGNSHIFLGQFENAAEHYKYDFCLNMYIYIFNPQLVGIIQSYFIVLASHVGAI